MSRLAASEPASEPGSERGSEPGSGPARVTVGQVTFHTATADVAAARMREALARGEGGRIVTLDTGQHRNVAVQPELRASIADASLVLTTSSAVVLASRLIATAERLPRRVIPLALTDAVCAACNADARPSSHPVLHPWAQAGQIPCMHEARSSCGARTSMPLECAVIVVRRRASPPLMPLN